MMALSFKGVEQYQINQKTNNSEIFLQFLEELIKNKANEDPTFNSRNVIFLDNATIHSSERIKDLLNKYKVTILYNSPYSPYLNIIEYAFGFIKQSIRKI